MAFVIKRNADGAYVRPVGSRASYTDKLQLARKFTTREQAEAECCANEHVVSIEDELGE